MINAERIVEMKRLSDAAMPAPWGEDINGWFHSKPAHSHVIFTQQPKGTIITRGVESKFIRESRQFVPDIIAAYEETKKQSAFWYEQFVNMTDAHAEQAEEIAKLRKALEYYAEIGNYIVQGEGHLASSIVDDDLGASARDALK